MLHHTFGTRLIEELPRGFIGLLEFHQLDTAREVGRIAARQALKHASAGPVAGSTVHS